MILMNYFLYYKLENFRLLFIGENKPSILFSVFVFIFQKSKHYWNGYAEQSRLWYKAKNGYH